MSPAAKPHQRRLPSHQPTIDDCRHDQEIWSSLDLQLRHRHCRHAAERAELLREVELKLSDKQDAPYYRPEWLSRKKWFNYEVTATVIACSSYVFRGDVVRCGYKVGPFKFSCRDPLCPRCSYNLCAKPLAEEFGGVDLAGMEVYYIVVSLSKQTDERHRLIFRDADHSDLIGIKRQGLATPCPPEDYGIEFKSKADVEQIRLWWAIVRRAIREFVKKRKRRGIRGAIGGPELAVRFTPFRVLPHINMILWADSFTVEDARELRRLITKRMRDSSRLRLRLLPCVACHRLASADDIRHVLKYSFKAIGLADAYVRSAELANFELPAMAALNREVNTFLRHLPDVFHHLRRVDRHGECHAGSNSYIGVVTPRRAARRERDDERRRAMRENGSPSRVYGRSSPAADATKPIHSRASARRGRFAYWLAATQPPPPPPPPPTASES